MSAPRAIPSRPRTGSQVSASAYPYSSTSPITVHSPNTTYGFGRPATKQLRPFHHGDVKVLLLENVNRTGINKLKDQGYQVEALKGSLTEDQLIDKIR